MLPYRPPSSARQAAVRHDLRENSGRSLTNVQCCILVGRNLMPGTVVANIRESPRVLILSCLDSIDILVRERLAILIRKFGLQAVGLVKKHIRNWARMNS
jgi:hypothetical protein